MSPSSDKVILKIIVRRIERMIVCSPSVILNYGSSTRTERW